YLEKFGITHTFVDGREASDIFDQIRPNTSLVYLESPGSIIFRLQDLKAIADHCRRAGISTIVDNTYGLTIQHPIELGIDICVHSASKVISGHSDVVAGALATSKKRIDRIMDAELELFGSIIAPLPAWLMIRGLRTLPMRLSRTRESANKVAEFVAGRPEVEELFHVGHSSFTQPELRDRQMTGSAGLLSFLPKTNDRSKIKAFLESFRIFKMGVSWGGHESLVVPVKMKPMDWPTERYVLRLCVGFESPEDLCSDLERAFPNLA
ncbi:MAG: PLP-dependent aspartate aminotransferase family protein, partial [Armatimonadota bacterium]